MGRRLGWLGLESLALDPCARLQGMNPANSAVLGQQGRVQPPVPATGGKSFPLSGRQIAVQAGELL